MSGQSVLQKIRDNGIDETFYGYLHSVYTAENRTYRVKVSAPQTPLETPFKHAIKSAQKIGETARLASKTVYLCMSGGADSEAMAQVFIAASVPFEVRIARYNGGLNSFDIAAAVTFCKRHGIQYRFVDIDLFDHYKRRQPFKYALLNGCQSPQFSVHMKLASEIGGYPVFAGNPPHISKDRYTSHLKLHVPRLREWAMQRHLDSMGGGVAFFFFSVPELPYSFLRSPVYRRCVQEQKTMSYLDKIKVYNSSGFSILPREQKFGGFERIKILYDMRHLRHFHDCYDNVLRWNLDIIGPFPKAEVGAFSKKFLPTYLGGASVVNGYF